MSKQPKAAARPVFSVDQVRADGPFQVCRCVITKSILKRELRRIERRLSLPTPGFRSGRSPAVFIYRSHHRAVDAELITRLRQAPPAELQQLLSRANLPPEFKVEAWDGAGPLVIVVRLLIEPSIANPAGRFGGMAGSASTSPLEPQAGWDSASISRLPQSQSQLLASHGIGLGSSLPGVGSGNTGHPTRLNPAGVPDGSNPVGQPKGREPGRPEEIVQQRAGNPSPQVATPTSPQPEQSQQQYSEPVRQAVADSNSAAETSGGEMTCQ